jgi:hypothetical protein
VILLVDRIRVSGMAILIRLRLHETDGRKMVLSQSLVEIRQVIIAPRRVVFDILSAALGGR